MYQSAGDIKPDISEDSSHDLYAQPEKKKPKPVADARDVYATVDKKRQKGMYVLCRFYTNKNNIVGRGRVQECPKSHPPQPLNQFDKTSYGFSLHKALPKLL